MKPSIRMASFLFPQGIKQEKLSDILCLNHLSQRFKGMSLYVKRQPIFSDCHLDKHIYCCRNSNPHGITECFEFSLCFVFHSYAYYCHSSFP